MRTRWTAVLPLAALLTAGCAAKQEQPATMARARELMAAAEGKRGDVVLRCEPADAEVLLDGVQQGLCSDFSSASRSLRLGDAGFHQVQVKKRGFWPYTTYYEPSGARVTLKVKLRPTAPEAGGDAP
ncbi:PEGA domain-containing protein [Corallococcus sp. ZKHCc1 1396]|uniref:PEGA domain-containing protein n=1 Tax=Corallococcus soli TaxID=2710757 RepID=A0ABR9PYC5_9BACT|nr:MULTISPECIES: PEGA domain-containing protein [Corallococcus]MBE4752936.1 PEGA domain-containing protein [Corallococcus soli]MCY1037074.1 PEGA domain-containing protein [Corallococcus sp. BB11-1]